MPTSASDNDADLPLALGQAALIVLAVLAVYIPAMRAGFVWDDDTSLLKNIGVEEHGLLQIWFSTNLVNYWPVTWTSFWLEHELWGFRPTGYHVNNVLVHAASSLLVWRVLLRLQVPGAWLAALVFAVHPVNVESVAWISQRKNVLSMLFYVSAVLCYLRFDSREGRRWYWFAVVAFVLSMLSKGAAAAFPVVLLLLAWWQRDRITRRDLLRTVPFFLVTAVMAATEIWFQQNRAIRDTVIRDAGFFERLAASGWIVWFYLYKAMLPFNLMFVYPQWEVDPGDWLSYVPGVLLLVVLGVCWWSRKSWGRPPLFALSYFVVTLGPILGFIDFYYLRFSLVGDHYQYFSMAAIIALAVGFLSQTIERNAADYRPLSRIGAALLVVVLGCLSWRQAGIYTDEATLWDDTLRKNPDSWIAWNNRGTIFRKQGHRQFALQYFHRAHELSPSNPRFCANIAEEYLVQSHFYEAQRYYRLALRHAPNYWQAHNGLAAVLAELEQFDEAIEYIKRAIAAAPSDAPSLPTLHYNHASFLRDHERLDESVAAFERALELDPENIAVLNNLATVLLSLDRVEETTGHLRKALSVEPYNAMLHLNLGIALEKQGLMEEAQEHFKKAQLFGKAR